MTENNLKSQHLSAFCEDSPVGLLQLLDLPLQLQVVGATCRHPAERERIRGEDKIRKEESVCVVMLHCLPPFFVSLFANIRLLGVILRPILSSSISTITTAAPLLSLSLLSVPLSHPPLWPSD